MSIQNSHLFGDAKAGAVGSGTDRRKRTYETAKVNAQSDGSHENMYKWASAAFDIGLYEEAEKVFSSLLKNSAEDMQILVDLGFTYKNMGKTEEAKDNFRKAIGIKPKSSLARCAENELWMMDPSYRPSWMRGADK